MIDIAIILRESTCDMEKNDNKMSYGQLLDELDFCEKYSDAEFEIYQKLAALAEREIDGLEEDIAEGVAVLPNGNVIHENPGFLDDYAAPMDNLARLYIKRKEYAKALALLEKALPIYRTLEIFELDYTYQRYYALELMVECLKQLDQRSLAILYEYELKYLKRDVLEKREKNLCWTN